jgi:hypothetical protein
MSLATFQQILVPFVGVFTVKFMAAHSWRGFRRLFRWEATERKSAVHTFHLQQILPVRRSKKITVNPQVPQNAPTMNQSAKMLRW